MSTSSTNIGQFPYLSPQQRDLLRSALESNKRAKAANSPPQNALATTSHSSAASNNRQTSSTDVDRSSSSNGGAMTFGDSLFPDFNDNNTNFDIDYSNMDGDLLDYSNLSHDDSPSGDSADTGEKRKSPEDDEDDDGEVEGGKRRESEEKIAKKPGRKLITTEPTTKRKAQNRAAQRAFRERKEKHLKDLEQKVTDLEKQSESTNQENSVLRAKIDILQKELGDYKKRLSVGGNAIGTSSAFSDVSSIYASPSRMSGHLSDFQFDFSRFGESQDTKLDIARSRDKDLLQPSANGNSPVTQVSSSSPGTVSTGQFFPGSPYSQAAEGRGVHRFEPGIFTGVGDVDFSNNFGSPQELATSVTLTSGHGSTSNQSRSASTANSPESSTGVNNTSSCGTSPEPLPNYSQDGVKTFADLNFSGSGVDSFPGFAPSQTLYDFSNFDFLSSQNGGQFNPELFGGYRESQAAVVGDGDFSSGFFEDPYSYQDFTASATNMNFDIANASNLNFTSTNAGQEHSKATPTPTMQPAAPKAGTSLMEHVARCRDGETGDEPAVSNRELMTTHKLWNQLQTCPRFLSGDLDIDSLCSELSAKATCSETGMTVPKDVVEKVLWRLVGDSEAGGQQEISKAKSPQMDVKLERKLDREAMRPLDICP